MPFGQMDEAVSTHSRLKAAGWCAWESIRNYTVSTHSRLKAAGWKPADETAFDEFQHTAA